MSKSVKISISLPAAMLAEVKREAKRTSTSVSCKLRAAWHVYVRVTG